MKRLFLGLALLCVPILFCLPVSAQSFAIPSAGGQYSFGTVSAVGQLGSAISYTNVFAPPSSYTIDWSNDGTAPVACTFYPEGSSDGVHWYQLATSDATGATMTPFSCTVAGSFAIAFKPVVYFRIRVVSYSPASDNTDRVKARYTRGAN